jgi:CDP-paratose 2-epimerase
MRVLITGGLGFIGVNTALDFFKNGHDISIIDNLSRKGNIENYTHLQENIKFTLYNRDIRNYFDMENIFKSNKFDVVIHLAAQVAVTSSVKNPREDFEINCLGTFNILECLRLHCPDVIMLYSSTNKVYGNFKSKIEEKEFRYVYGGDVSGINEEQNLDFHSPYGCSKGSADQYARDYNRIYGLKTVVLRQSCIYGPNQFGIEDQGWVSWFSIASLFNKKFTIYGDGKQVRDVLHVYDLIELYKSVIKNIDTCSGNIYNAGGGPENTMSLLELIKLIENKLGEKLTYGYSDWRPGDQKIYISDISKIKNDTEWQPVIDVETGVCMMIDWISNNRPMFKKLNLV